ncbi:MAG: hypothetical protein GKR95_08860 [Gammaproteobacteria bacterium]|nr:hypothetical protein [Gammaproteobacteria bacterium]
MSSPSPWEGLKSQFYLGREELVNEAQSKPESGVDITEAPRLQCHSIPKPLGWYSREAVDRNSAILEAYASGGYSMREIVDFLD